MKRDFRTQPFFTPLPAGDGQREATVVFDPRQTSADPAPPPTLTEPATTQRLLTEALPAEFRITEPAGATEPTATEPAPTAPTPTEPTPTEPTPTQPAAATQPAPTELVAAPAAAMDAEVRPPLKSEPLVQLDRLAALVEQELRKSNPAYRLAASAPELDPQPLSAEEESLQAYLDRFMERVTGKKPNPVDPIDPVAPAPSPSMVSELPRHFSPPNVPEVPEPPPVREHVRPPECRESLAAMRDLANENARSAVAAHLSRQEWQGLRLTFLVAGASSLVSSGAAAWHLASAAPGAVETAVCAGLLAILLAYRFFRRCGQLAAPTGTA